MFDRSRAIPYSNHGVERETRLELATLTLARYCSHSVFGMGGKWPLNEYLPPTSTGLNADRTGIDADHTGVHVGHQRRLQVGGRVRRSTASRGPKHLFDARPTASRSEECPAGNFGRCPLNWASKSA
jgi:hypothetical protein